MKPSGTEIAGKAKEFAKQDRVRGTPRGNGNDEAPMAYAAERADYLIRSELEALREQEQ
jgi:hypothetical protein